MATPHPFADGGYSFLEGGFPYSQGVAALPGYAIERVRFARPVPLARGFALISEFLEKAGRPRTALCAAELRSPKPFSFSGFAEFNKGYVAVLEKWGIYRNKLNPVARSNVAPETGAPAEPCFYAFCYTVPSSDAGTFVVAGSGEWPEGGRFPEDIVAHGDTSDAGMRRKAEFVLGKMDARLEGLGVSWGQSTVTQVYTVENLQRELMGKVQRHTRPSSLTWHYCRPPIEGLDYEMDVRGVRLERVL
jgi:hypothetical protein